MRHIVNWDAIGAIGEVVSAAGGIVSPTNIRIANSRGIGLLGVPLAGGVNGVTSLLRASNWLGPRGEEKTNG